MNASNPFDRRDTIFGATIRNSEDGDFTKLGDPATPSALLSAARRAVLEWEKVDAKVAKRSRRPKNASDDWQGCPDELLAEEGRTQVAAVVAIRRACDRPTNTLRATSIEMADGRLVVALGLGCDLDMDVENRCVIRAIVIADVPSLDGL
jgi:hypothetical protein